MYAHEEKCSLCGTTFLRRIYDAEIPSDKADVTKPLCPECRAKERERKEREREEREKEIRFSGHKSYYRGRQYEKA